VELPEKRLKRPYSVLKRPKIVHFAAKRGCFFAIILTVGVEREPSFVVSLKFAEGQPQIPIRLRKAQKARLSSLLMNGLVGLRRIPPIRQKEGEWMGHGSWLREKMIRGGFICGLNATGRVKLLSLVVAPRSFLTSCERLYDRSHDPALCNPAVGAVSGGAGVCVLRQSCKSAAPDAGLQSAGS
jgi:hypothetical protein